MSSRWQSAGIRMVTTAVHLDPVREIIKKYEAGEREAVSTHAGTNCAGRSISYMLVILERGVLKKEYAGMTPGDRKLAKLHDKDALVRQHYMFATTMSEGRIGGDHRRVTEFYRKRCGMENSCKSYEQMRPRTASTDYFIRILFWFIPFLFYNIWILARFLAAHHTRRAYSRRCSWMPQPTGPPNARTGGRQTRWQVDHH